LGAYSAKADLSLPSPLIAWPIAAVLAIDTLGFLSTLLARCEYNRRASRDSDEILERCAHCFASPRALQVLCAGASLTFLSQLALLPLFVCLGLLLEIMGVVCSGGDSSLIHAQSLIGTASITPSQDPWMARVQDAFISLDATKYCTQSDDPLVPSSPTLLIGWILTVVSQAGMMASLAAEWERVGEELWYNGEDASDDAGEELIKRRPPSKAKGVVSAFN
jgi:hypothetical protein